MNSNEWQDFIQRLAAICQQSGALSWKNSLYAALHLFADTIQASEAALYLLDELGAPLDCVSLVSDDNASLCPQFAKGSALWQTFATSSGFREFTNVESDTHYWILTVPPDQTSPRAVFVFADVLSPLSGKYLEQGASLITPLVQNAQLDLMECHQVLARASSALTQTLDQGQILDRILEQISLIIPHDACSVILFSGENIEVVRQRGYAQFGAADIVAAGYVTLVTPIIREVLDRRVSVVISDTEHSELWSVIPGFEWIRSNLTTPIMSQNNVIGFVSVDGRAPDFFTEQHTQRLQIFTDYVSIALQNAQVYQNEHKQAEKIAVLFDELQKRQTYLEGLNTVTATVNSEMNLDDILSTGLDQAIQIADMIRGAIYLLDQSDARFQLRVHQGFTPEALEQAKVCRLGLGVTGRIFAETSPWGADTMLDVVTAEDAQHIPAYISLPLVVENQVVGVMSLEAAARQNISPGIQQLLSAIADQLALAVQRGRLTSQMQEQLQTVHYLYEISAALLSQMDASTIIFILLRTLTDVVEGTMSTAFYRFVDGERWRRERIYALEMTSELANQGWSEGDAWEAELAFLNACRGERMLVLSSRQRGRIPSSWEDIEALGAGQMLYFPLFLPNHDFFGVVNVMVADDRVLTAHESTLTWAVVQQGSAALVRVRLYENSRKSESRLRAILESSRDGIFLVGHNLMVHYVNGQALRLLDLPGDTTTWENQTLADVITATRGEAPKFAGWLTQIARGVSGRDIVPQDEAITFETAHGLLLMLQYTPVYSEHEHSPGSLLLLRDITEQRALERMRDDLLSMLVHDMRNPLSVIQNAIQLLEDPNMCEMSDEVIGIAMTNTDKLLELVNTILEIGRLESGRFDLSQEAVYLPDYIYEVARDIAVPTNVLTIKTTIPVDLPLLWVDISVVKRVFENVLGNALKFVPEKQGLIRISSIEEENWITIEVYNSGPHIPPNIYKKLFQKFMSGEHTARGYGLGLAFCKFAIEAHGGQIWAQNQPEGGVSFYFTLPVFHVPDFPDEDL